MEQFKRDLDRRLTSEPPDNTWWFELVNEYIQDFVTAEEWEKREAEFNGFLDKQQEQGLNPPAAAVAFMRELFPDRFGEYSQTYPLRVPDIGECWQCDWLESVVPIKYVVLGYEERYDRVILRLHSESEKQLKLKDRMIASTYSKRRPTLAGLYREFTQLADKQR